MNTQQFVQSNSPQDKLELDDKPDLHHQGWIWQSILWVVLGAFILAGLLGVFGDGILGKKILGDKHSNHWIKYSTMARQNAPMTIEIHCVAIDNGSSVITFPSAYLKEFQIQTITPSPTSVITRHDQLYYHFTGKGNMTILFHLKPEESGSLQASIQINNQTFSLSHFIYP